MTHPTRLSPLVIAAGLLVASPLAAAANVSFIGNFSQDDNLRLFSFSLSAPSTVTLVSRSYAGGTLANGTPISAGGFDVVLSLFDAAGAQLGVNDDAGSTSCGPATIATDPITGALYDSCLSQALGAGAYQVALTQYSNFPVGPLLSDGFSLAGLGNFTACAAAPAFCDATGSARSSAWALDILNVDSASTVPPTTPVSAPGVLGLIGSALAVMGLRRRRMG